MTAVRFGKYSSMRNKERNVEIFINGAVGWAMVAMRLLVRVP